MFTSHKEDWGMCMYHEWSPRVDLDNPSRMKISIWVSIHKLPFEFQPIGRFMTSKLGIELGFDQNHHVNLNPRFCVSMEVDKGWVAALMIKAIGNQWFMASFDCGFNPIRCSLDV
jgi:hypothetical protein